MKAFMNIGIKLSRHLRTRLLKPWQSVLGIRQRLIETGSSSMVGLYYKIRP